MTDKQISESSMGINLFGNEILDDSLSQVEKEELKERIIMAISSNNNPNT
ncbi:MAG: hypothetical protein LUD48_01705 [Prevotella sp.]|nr:hypothetical protein [Prevotella sp.]